jgi:hypothetical protein
MSATSAESSDGHEHATAEYRRWLEESVDDDLVLRLFERRIVALALEGRADDIFRRYLMRYVVPLVVVISAVATFLGWQIRDTVRNGLASIETNKQAVERIAGEARALAQQSATTLREANGQLQSIIDTRIAFATHLATIATQGAGIADRSRDIDVVATTLTERQRLLAAQLDDARNQATSATDIRNEITTRRAEITDSVRLARDAETQARQLVSSAEVNNRVVAVAATNATTAANEAARKLSEIDELRTKADKLLKVGVFEVVILRSHAKSSKLKLANIVAKEPGRDFEVSFETTDIRQIPFPLQYAVNGKVASQLLPAMNNKEMFPFRFPLEGTGGQYEVVIDLIYSFRTAPDFVALHVKPIVRD